MRLVGTIHVPEATPSANQVARWQRKQAWKYREYKTRAAQWVMVEVANREIPRATGPRLLKFFRSYRSLRYRLDDDNFVGGCKALRDACITRGVILDDDAENLVAKYQQVRCPEGESWTEIEVYDFDSKEEMDNARPK